MFQDKQGIRSTCLARQAVGEREAQRGSCATTAPQPFTLITTKTIKSPLSPISAALRPSLSDGLVNEATGQLAR